MKITETIERECCHPDDLVKYQGVSGIPAVLKPKFCKHCGQLWILERFTDAAGDSDSEYRRHRPELQR